MFNDLRVQKKTSFCQRVDYKNCAFESATYKIFEMSVPTHSDSCKIDSILTFPPLFLSLSVMWKQ